MLFGIKIGKTVLLRHIFIGFLAALTAYLFWLSRPELALDIGIWRAVGDASFSFLFITLIIGPLAKLWRPALRLVQWRREFGIWFALLAITHFLRVSEFALSEPGIELPRLLGLTAFFFSLLLLASSSDRVVNFAGISSWKWLQSFAYITFYFVVLHASYFLFMRYPEAKNWFRYPFLGMALTVFTLQISAFIKTIIQQKHKGSNEILKRKN